MDIQEKITSLERQLEMLKKDAARQLEDRFEEMQRSILEMKKEAETRVLPMKSLPAKGQLCLFWDKWVSQDGWSVPFQAMIRPFHHASYIDESSLRAGHLTSTGSGYRYFSMDAATDAAIGHGWKYCHPLPIEWSADLVNVLYKIRK